MSIRTGLVFLWSGAISDIPDGWCLCDGRTYEGDTIPDLRNYFIPGAGSSYNPSDTGGSLTHNHTFTGDGHFHFLPAGASFDLVPSFDFITDTQPIAGTFDNGSTPPQYYALSFVIKL